MRAEGYRCQNPGIPHQDRAIDRGKGLFRASLRQTMSPERTRASPTQHLPAVPHPWTGQVGLVPSAQRRVCHKSGPDAAYRRAVSGKAVLRIAPDATTFTASGSRDRTWSRKAIDAQDGTDGDLPEAQSSQPHPGTRFIRTCCAVLQSNGRIKCGAPTSMSSDRIRLLTVAGPWMLSGWSLGLGNPPLFRRSEK